MAEQKGLPEILRDPVPSNLIKAIEDNTIESILSWSTWSRIEVHTDGDTIWTVSDIPFYLFNLVLPTRTSSDGPGALIDTAIARASLRETPMVCWVGPSNPYPAFQTALVAKGFIHAATLTGMAVELSALDNHSPVPERFSIHEVKSLEDPAD